jgi:hypothetical protein
MPYSVVDKPSKYFNTVLYSGNASTQSITGVGFKPDFVWIKGRSGTYGVSNHKLYDVVRGATKTIWSNLTTAETTQTNTVTSFDTDGFSLGDDTNVNWSSTTYTSWNWLASNTSGSSNTAGTITSTVSANTTSGFSIVSYTGNSSASQSVGHGLGVAPKMIIVKNRDVGTRNWKVYHSGLGSPSLELTLNSSSAQGTDTQQWANTVPTSSLFYVGASGESNNSGSKHIAYCFAEVKGFSKAFSYTGNGSADGSYVHLGFRPAWLLIKSSSTAGEYWQIIDNKRDTFNVTYRRLFPNVSDAENTALNPNIDFLSNGFKCRTASSGTNGSGTTYIGFAIAENPFTSSKGIPACAV